MQVTLDIPDSLAAQLASAGKEPALAALDVLEEWATRESTARSLSDDPAEQAEVREAIREGLEDRAAGRIRPAREVFAEFRQKHGIPR